MKSLFVPLPVLAVTAAPALAHSGAHAHPHGIDTGAWALGLFLVAAGVAAVFVASRR
ncbi:peptidase M23 [Rhodovulum sp. YNF3179]|jgi:hypothetical protein|uniref:peptidase M23 n=1 Tax=Rhodovulum sp. YNF3179 TaxID=3425127 RepID=UPI003D32AC72